MEPNEKTPTKRMEDIISAKGTSNFLRCCLVMALHDKNWVTAANDAKILAEVLHDRASYGLQVFMQGMEPRWKAAGFGSYEDYRKAGGK